MIPSVKLALPGEHPVYQRGLVIDSQPRMRAHGGVTSISKGIGD